MGTGTGQAALPLTKWYKKVIGFDPSPGQLSNVSVTAGMVAFEEHVLGGIAAA